MNALYEAIEKHAMKGRIKLIGIGANNSPFEVQYFKDTYEVPFPLFPDGNMAILNALGGEVRTPYFIALRNHKNGRHDIFYTHLGGFNKADDFLQSIIQLSGLK